MTSPAAAYLTFLPTSREWTLTAYDNGARLPLAFEGFHGSAFAPSSVGTINPAMREARRILTESGLITSGTWAIGPVTPEQWDFRIALQREPAPHPGAVSLVKAYA